jgi:hypothetical protein
MTDKTRKMARTTIPSLDTNSTDITFTQKSPVKDAADRIQDGLKIYEMFRVPLSEKRKA